MAWALPAAGIAWNLVALHAETRAVAYANDSAMHVQMVRAAAKLVSEGRLPLTAWYPYLGLGSPHFLHYQALPAMITGLVGQVTGPDVAFRWSLYLLLSLWPLSVYWSARLFGLRPSGAGLAAAMSPFIVSVVGLGYEQSAYVYIGYGVWTQLWASFTLPLAWGYSWRAIEYGGPRLPAAALVALTTALHFETGYLAVAPLLLFPLLGGRERLRARVNRAAVVVAGTMLLAAWVIVPVIGLHTWAATNEVLRGTTMADGYSAPKLLFWLVSGGLLDAGRVPVITPFAVCGAVLAAVHWREWKSARPLLALVVLSLLLAAGRTTFGGFASLVPGASDIFFRRFTMGAQLALVLLAGVSADWVLREAQDVFAHLRQRMSGLAVAVGACVAVVGLLAPAWIELDDYDASNAAAITAQQHAEAADMGDVDRLIALARRLGGGRVYAGAPTDFGRSFTIGAVPVFKYLAARDVDEVGFDLRTASLMTGPEYFFTAGNVSDDVLFGIRYLLLPIGQAPPTPATHLLSAGRFALWRTSSGGYLHLGDVVGDFTADRTDIGRRSLAVEHSELPGLGQFLRAHLVVDEGRPSVSVARAAAVTRTSPGTFVAQAVDLGEGRATAKVRLLRPATVVLSASYDPGWRATVDGRASPVVAIAPALVGIAVGAGVHSVHVTYNGYSRYPALACLAAMAVLVLLGLDVRDRRARRGQRGRRLLMRLSRIGARPSHARGLSPRREGRASRRRD